jgi:TetR/AcrR family transcriptional repressor of nem operon
LRDLLQAMGIGESSFYHSLKSKQSLYLACLQHYNATVTRRRWDALTAQRSVQQGVRHYFKAVLDDLDNPHTPNVCLMAGSLAPDVLSVAELQEYVLGEMQALEAALAARLDAARQAGELPPTVDAVVAAQVIVTFLQGLFRVVRVLTDRAHMERQIEAVLRGLGL